MKFTALTAGTAVVALVTVGGLYALAPEVHGQIINRPARAPGMGQDGFEELTRARIALEQRPLIVAGGSRIGASVRDVEPSDVTGKKLTAQSGAIIDEVRSETPAAKAGLRAGDVVIAFDGERVRSASQLRRLVDETPTGRRVPLSVMRDGSGLALVVVPESSSLSADPATAKLFHGLATKMFDGRSWKGDDRAALQQDLLSKLRDRKFERFSAPAFESEFGMDEGNVVGLTTRPRLGVTAEGVSDQLATYFGVTSGVLVQHVAEDSAAAKAGMKAGDVITAVNGTSIKDAADLRRVVAEAGEGQELTLSVTRERKTMTLKTTIEKPEVRLPRFRWVV